MAGTEILLDKRLRATLEQRVEELALDRTLQASPTATIKPSRGPRIKTDQDPSRLPRISVVASNTTALPRSAAEGTHGSPGSRADLELRELLGEGGMGRVHAAFQRSLGREVAIKRLRADADPAQGVALLQEAIFTGALEHPGVVPVHALGVDDQGLPVLVMKRIDGVHWGALIHEQAHAAWASRPGDRVHTHLEILMHVCRTVHFAHTRGVLHRDIKPENVMLGEFGETYLVDWGIAHALGTDGPSLAGTPAYMAPEMVTGEGIDVRSDVYLLGAVLHEVLTGENRNAGENVQAVLASSLMTTPFSYDASIPAELAAICNRATALNPDDRFTSADELRLAIVEHLRHRGAIALVQQASMRSAELASLLAEQDAAPPSDLRRAYQLASEGRFAYEAALREWPENPEAQRGLDAFRVLAIDLELRQGHVEAAEALLRDVESPPALLLEKLEAARRERERTRAERERLKAIDREVDPTVSARARVIALVFFALAALAVGVALLRWGDLTTSPRLLLAVGVGFFLVTCVVAVVFRRWFLANAFNRKALGILLIGNGTFVVSRTVALAEHLSFRDTIVQELVVLAALMGVVAVTMVRAVWSLAVLALTGAGVCLLYPERTMLVIGAVTVLMPLICAYAFSGRRRESAAGPV